MSYYPPATFASEVERDEGRVPYAYQDSKGYWTIAVGILIDKRRGGLRPEEIDFLRDNRLRLICEELDRRRPSWRDLSEARQGVIVGMCYNLGVNGCFRFRNMWLAIEMGDFARAAEEIMDSEVARELTRRYTRYATAMRTGA